MILTDKDIDILEKQIPDHDTSFPFWKIKSLIDEVRRHRKSNPFPFVENYKSIRIEYDIENDRYVGIISHLDLTDEVDLKLDPKSTSQFSAFFGYSLDEIRSNIDNFYYRCEEILKLRKHTPPF